MTTNPLSSLASLGRERQGIRYAPISNDIDRYSALLMSMRETLERVSPGITSQEDPEGIRISHLYWMTNQCLATVNVLDVAKLNRWIGYIQGCLVILGVSTLAEERRRVKFFMGKPDDENDGPVKQPEATPTPETPATAPASEPATVASTETPATTT
jgi:hypothetical protein